MPAGRPAAATSTEDGRFGLLASGGRPATLERTCGGPGRLVPPRR
ncbi:MULTISPECIES: hypothetical protein [Protofrankia]|nr:MULTISPECIES: hypothetical protein [Protofrankia]